MATQFKMRYSILEAVDDRQVAAERAIYGQFETWGSHGGGLVVTRVLVRDGFGEWLVGNIVWWKGQMKILNHH
jgi:hypothetical protein